MTAAHLPGAILTPRCRGARAVATFSGGVESRNAPARIAPATPCSSLGVERRHGCTQHFHHGCTKSRVGASDAGSIPATSTTMGVQGFDGALIRDGQPAMVPAALGSPLSRGPVRWAKSKLPTTTAITSSALRDVPAGRGVTNAGTLGGSDALKPKHSDRQRPARFAAALCRLPRPFYSL